MESLGSASITMPRCESTKVDRFHFRSHWEMPTARPGRAPWKAIDFLNGPRLSPARQVKDRFFVSDRADLQLERWPISAARYTM